MITILNFFSWFSIIFHKYRHRTISKYLKSHNKISDTNESSLNKFIENFCHLDGAFVFAIIRRNTNYMTTSEIISNLFVKYCLDAVRLKNRNSVNGNGFNRDDNKSVIEINDHQEEEDFALKQA